MELSDRVHVGRIALSDEDNSATLAVLDRRSNLHALKYRRRRAGGRSACHSARRAIQLTATTVNDAVLRCRYHRIRSTAMDATQTVDQDFIDARPPQRHRVTDKRNKTTLQSDVGR